MKMFKKLLLTLVSLFALLSTNLCIVGATTTDKIESADYQFSVNFLSEYYNAIDQYTQYDLTNYIDSENLLKYSQKKIEAKSSKSIAYSKNDMQNYKLSFELLSREKFNNYLKLSIAVKAEFNYIGTNIESAYGEVNQILISTDTKNYKIKDWYIGSDPYDVEIRGEFLNIKNNDFWSSNSKNISSINTIQENLNNEIINYYETLQTQLQENKIESPLQENFVNSTRATLYSLNRNSMITWANNNCDKTYPSSGNYTVIPGYYDFSTIAGSYDCTNFASHSILAGGSAVYDTGLSGIQSTGWYFRSINNRASSWSGVIQFYDFVIPNTTKGPSGAHVNYTNINASSVNRPYQAGDLLQFHSGTVWIHTTLITGFTYMSGSTTTLEALVTGRSSVGAFQKNTRQSQVYTNKSRRVIKFNGYYK